MPRSRSINSYPESFWQIVEQAATAKRIFEFPIQSLQEGLSLQGKFYHFRGALQKEAGRLGMLLPAEHPQRIKVETAMRQIQEIVCFVDRKGMKVQMMHRNATPEAKMFEAALARAGVSTVDEELAESARRLLKERGAEPPVTGGKYG